MIAEDFRSQAYINFNRLVRTGLELKGCQTVLKFTEESLATKDDEIKVYT
jgi:hypothetical protein